MTGLEYKWASLSSALKHKSDELTQQQLDFLNYCSSQ